MLSLTARLENIPQSGTPSYIQREQLKIVVRLMPHGDTDDTIQSSLLNGGRVEEGESLQREWL